MSEILKYKKALNFRANPRYLRRDFIVPLYTGTEPDIYEDKKPNINDQEIIVDPSMILPKNFTDDMPFAPQQNIPGQQLELADGGSVERQGFEPGGIIGSARFGLYKQIGDPNVKKPTYTLKGNKWPDKETKNFYENQIKKRFEYAKNSSELLNQYTSGKLLTNKQLAKKYNISVPVVKRLNKTIVKDFELKDKPIIGREESKRKRDAARRKAKLDFSNPYFEEKIKGNYKTHLGHMGDLYNRIVTSENLGYTPKEINDAMKETIDPALRQISIEQDKLIKNKPPGWKKQLRVYNQKGINYSSLAQGYKSFDIIDPNTLKKYTYGVDYLKTIDPAFLYKGKSIREIAELTDKREMNKIQKAFDDLTEAKKIARTEGLEQADISKIKNSELLTEENLRKLQTFKAFEENRKAVLKAQSKIPTSEISKIKDQMIANMGCPTLTSKSIGGRVNFSNGSNCYMKGLEKIQSGELGNAERRIASQFLKEAGVGDELVKGILTGGKNFLKVFQEFALGTGVIGGLTGAALTVPFAGAESARGSPGGFGRELISSLIENVNIIPGVDIDAAKIAGTQVTQALERSARPGSQKMANYLFPIQEQSRKIDDLNKKLKRFTYLRDNPSIESTPVSDQQIEIIQKQIGEEKLILQDLTNNLKKNITGEDLNDVKKDITALQAEAFKRAKKIADLRISNVADPDVKKYVQENPDRVILNAENIPTFINNLASEYGESARPLIDQITRNFENIKTLGEQGKEETGILSPSGFIDVTDIFNNFLRQSEGYQTILDKQDLETKPLTEDQRINIEEMGARGGAAEGGRIGLKEGTKIGKRGFLKAAAALALTPEIIKTIKGAGQTGKIASKIKIEPAEGMYPWFPKLVEKVKEMGKPFKEEELIMEASYKNDPRPFLSGIPKGEEKLTKHVDGDTTFILREYPDGRLAVDIDSPRNQQSFGQPVSLYYRPKMEFQNYKGEIKVEPAEFRVLEPEPKPFVTGPDDVDITFTEVPKDPSRNIVYADIEAAERFATGKIKNRKIIPVKQSLRNEMEEDPSTFIMRQSGELGSTATPEQVIKKTEDFATGGRVGFSGGGNFVKIARLISEALSELKSSTTMVSDTAKIQGVRKAKLEALTPYRNAPDQSQHTNILNKIERARENLPKEYHSILDDIKKDVDNFDYVTADNRIMALDEAVAPELKFESLSEDLFPMEDPLNNAFIIMDPNRNKMAGRYVQKNTVDPETGRGIIQTFDTFDSESRKFLDQEDWKLIGVESIEKGKEGLN